MSARSMNISKVWQKFSMAEILLVNALQESTNVFDSHGAHIDYYSIPFVSQVLPR